MRGSADQRIRSDQVTQSGEVICGAARSASNTLNTALYNGKPWITLVLLGVPNTCWGNVTRREIPTEHNHFRDEVHFYTVVKHLLDPLQRVGVIQPHVRENKEVEVGKLLLDPDRVLRLDDHRLNAVNIRQAKNCARLPAVLSLPCRGNLCDRIWIWMQSARSTDPTRTAYLAVSRFSHGGCPMAMTTNVVSSV